MEIKNRLAFGHPMSLVSKAALNAGEDFNAPASRNKKHRLGVPFEGTFDIQEVLLEERIHSHRRSMNGSIYLHLP